MIRRFATLATSISCFFAAAASADTATLMSETEFRNAIISAMQDTSETELCVARLSDDSFRAGLTTESCDYFAYLENLYIEYENDPARGEALISETAEKYVRLIHTGIDDTNFEERLVVQLRPASYLDENTHSTDGAIVARPFAGDLVAVLMLDSPETLAAVTEARLTNNGVSVEQAFDLAIQNTRSRMGEVYQDEYQKIDFLSSSNGLISGQIWLPETCSAETRDAAYFIYDHNSMMKVNLNNPLGVSNMLSLATGLVGQGESMANSVVRCKSGKWSQLWPAQTAEVTSFRFDPRL
ncbi:MAG: hypothetical protein CMK09_04145 [Ponticaulis sp.]|nr:hypothetical protein [Ponticaulis sp.]|tara:strand:- start:25412 stop:26302 length:891 start_codon:yes stop_codon:yes gene_type:complete